MEMPACFGFDSRPLCVSFAIGAAHPNGGDLFECIRRGEEQARGDHARFCSPACRLAAHREGKRPPGRPLCAHCGRPVDGLPPAARVFTFSASRAKFCSSRCRVAAWRKAHPSLKAATKAAEATRVAAIAADFALVEARAEVARVTAKGETITQRVAFIQSDEGFAAIAGALVSAVVDVERDKAGISAATRAMDMDTLGREMVAAMDNDPERYRELNVEFNIRCRERRR